MFIIMHDEWEWKVGGRGQRRKGDENRNEGVREKKASDAK